jgi:hypothetical protein
MARPELFHRGKLKSFPDSPSVDLQSTSSYDASFPSPPSRREAMEAVLLIQAVIIFALLQKFVL